MYTAALIVMALAAMCRVAAGSPPLLDRESDAGVREVVWLYDSPLSVYEEIIDLGEDLYRYSYSFENVDEKRIWFFGVYTTFPVHHPVFPWSTHLYWYATFFNNLDNIPDCYDGRNLDPDIVAVTVTSAQTGIDTPYPILPGESVDGFGFTSPTYNNNPKYYFYETVEDGEASQTGCVAAVGQTTPNLASESLAWSKVKATYR